MKTKGVDTLLRKQRSCVKHRSSAHLGKHQSPTQQRNTLQGLCPGPMDLHQCKERCQTYDPSSFFPSLYQMNLSGVRRQDPGKMRGVGMTSGGLHSSRAGGPGHAVLPQGRSFPGVSALRVQPPATLRGYHCV